MQLGTPPVSVPARRARSSDRPRVSPAPVRGADAAAAPTPPLPPGGRGASSRRRCRCGSPSASREVAENCSEAIAALTAAPNRFAERRAGSRCSRRAGRSRRSAPRSRTSVPSSAIAAATRAARESVQPTVEAAEAARKSAAMAADDKLRGSARDRPCDRRACGAPDGRFGQVDDGGCVADGFSRAARADSAGHRASTRRRDRGEAHCRERRRAASPSSSCASRSPRVHEDETAMRADVEQAAIAVAEQDRARADPAGGRGCRDRAPIGG